MGMKRKAWGFLATVVTAAAAVLVGAPTASAYGPSYCNSSTCDLSVSPSTGGIYFEMPRYTAVSMICWTDNQWYDGTNRWFKVNTVYGQGYMIANQVSNQTRVGHC
ncbi:MULTISPECIES: hypothetical protein [Streptomyces]|uniref:hypothetical protein n=1 Tax=Streptomyces TaxID=1883 RepID=UPI00131AB2D6|nr:MULTISPECIES: hypothetical protein [Streptomyces]MCH0558563.1 hypothetical protein [Streptomyces sp. MUM 16J]